MPDPKTKAEVDTMHAMARSVAFTIVGSVPATVDIRDLVQDAWVAGLEADRGHKTSREGPSGRKGYICTAMRYGARRGAKKARIRGWGVARELKAPEPPDVTHYRAEVTVWESDVRNYADRVCGELRDHDLGLRVLYGDSMAHVSRLSGRSVTSVRRAVDRVRDRLVSSEWLRAVARESHLEMEKHE